MPPSVCQGLESCLEPCLVEPRGLRLKLAQPKSNPLIGLPNPCDEETDTSIVGKNTSSSKIPNNTATAGLSFLQSITTDDSTNNHKYNNSVYIHPLDKNASSKLSEKSLEMCTESLGSETGSDGSECNDEISLLSLETENTLYKQRPKGASLPKKLKTKNSFPPPLTSISASNGIQVRPHREGGRLVLKAMAVSPSPSCFHADRSNGRLKLRLLESETVDKKLKAEEVGVYEHNENVGGTHGIEKFPEPTWRCNKGRRGNRILLNREQFWVAI